MVRVPVSARRCKDVKTFIMNRHTNPMHDDDNRLIIMEEKPQLAIWAFYTALTLLLLFAAIDYCYTVGDNGGG